MEINSEQFKTVLLFSKIAKVLKPKDKLQVSDWADRYRMLSPEASAEPGKWDTSRAEFQREIMNAVNNPDVEDIVIESSSQVGKTEILLNICGYFMDYEPATIMLLQPTIEMGETFSKDRLAPMIRDTPVLKDKVKEPRAKGSDNTILHKKFPGGHITIAGANSPSSLASRPIRVVLCDEIDRYPDSAGSEGDPVKLIEKRTTTYWNRKKIKVSTPTIDGYSKIDKEYQNGSMEEWSVGCPCCGKFQPYVFERLDFDTVTMQCYYCKENIDERDWKESSHKWIAKHPERTKKRSFHLNELCSPWKSWQEVIDDYLEAKEDFKKTGSYEKLKVFYNTSLGRTWKELGDGADSKELMKHRENYFAEIPDGVLILTAGVDTQDDRLEYEITGWARGYESWGIYKGVIFSDPALEETWDMLEQKLDQELYFSNGTGLNIAATCIDTGGHYTNNVYKFISSMEKKNKRIYGIKGYSNTPGIPLLYKQTKVEIKNDHGKVIDRTKIFILGVDAGKEDIISRLKIKEKGAGYCHFPINKERGYNQTYMNGITSEEKVTKYVKGKLKTMWIKKPGIRNEPLDLRNYSYAACMILNPNWESLEHKIENGINYMKVSSKKKKVRRKRGVVGKGVQI